jgi:threonine aldolase
MDRRHFLAAGGLAAVAPAFSQTAMPGQTAVAGEEGASPRFRSVNFYSDGVDYTPAEYATRLQAVTTREGFTADYYSLGGAVESLEKKFAALLGKEAAMFVPTGTLANHLAVRKLAGKDRRVLVQAESHYFNDSGDGAEALSGLTLVPMGLGQTDVTLDEVRAWVERSAGGRVETPVGVISVESPVRRRDHAMADFGELQRVSAYARNQGIRLHLDGARLFNVPLHSGKSLKEITGLFDTVYVSLWKHFNAASGAILAGDAAFIEGLFHQRRMFGGALPYAWPQMALVADHVDGYAEEYARAWRDTEAMMALLVKDSRFGFTRVPSGTSRYYMTVQRTDPVAMVERARRHDVFLSRPHPVTGTLGMQVNTSVLRSTPETLARVLIDAASG